jgi:hypothetical protein
MPSGSASIVLLLTLFQAAAPLQRAVVRAEILAEVRAVVGTVVGSTVSPQTLARTWVGTQRRAIDTPPPGAQDQPVSFTIEVSDGKITGTMTKNMGSD